jgi:hypothetical protein
MQRVQDVGRPRRALLHQNLAHVAGGACFLPLRRQLDRSGCDAGPLDQNVSNRRGPNRALRNALRVD